MPEQQDRFLPLFASHVFQLYVDYDTDALLQDKSWIYSANQDMKRPDENYRILEKYPILRDVFLDKSNKLAKEFYALDHEFMISTSWLTITEPGEGGQSQHHFHKNSFFSGVYYYDDYEEDAGEIEFMTPLEYHSDFYLEPVDYNLNNSSSWRLSPQKNMLVLFPSYLKHKVNEHKGTKPRYSLAMNFIPVGEYGTSDSTVNTGWYSGDTDKEDPLLQGFRKI